MKITEFMRTYGYTYRHLAQELNEEYSTLYKIIVGQSKKLPVDIAYKLIKLSDGLITLEDLVSKETLKWK